MLVERPRLTFAEKLYFPAILGGLAITFRHLLVSIRYLIFKKPKKNRTLMDLSASGFVTMRYPEEKWEMPADYRGAPTLVKDEDGREKCVSCQLCEFVCPPRAIRITPGDIPHDSPYAKIEKAPKEFQIDMLRCIYCGYCQEVCPEEAIFLRKDYYALVGSDRKGMIHDKKKLYELGGVFHRPIHKWANK